MFAFHLLTFACFSAVFSGTRTFKPRRAVKNLTRPIILTRKGFTKVVRWFQLFKVYRAGHALEVFGIRQTGRVVQLAGLAGNEEIEAVTIRISVTSWGARFHSYLGYSFVDMTKEGVVDNRLHRTATRTSKNNRLYIVLSTTRTLHVHHALLYISLPVFARLRRENA